MAKTKEQKREILEGLKDNIEKQKTMIFVDFKGLKVEDLFELRKRLKEVSSQFLVAKKTLLRLVFQEKDIKADVESMEGQIALVFGFEDELTPAKTVYNFSKENDNLKILGGFIESQKGEFLNSEAMINLGQLPSKEELLARLAGSMSAPLSNLISVLQGNLKGLVYALSAIQK
jgi:large subunit ribosomal protein L10